MASNGVPPRPQPLIREKQSTYNNRKDVSLKKKIEKIKTPQRILVKKQNSQTHAQAHGKISSVINEKITYLWNFCN